MVCMDVKSPSPTKKRRKSQALSMKSKKIFFLKRGVGGGLGGGVGWGSV